MHSRIPGLIAAFMLALTPSARAQTYPERPIKLVMPFAPGSAPDVVGRLLAQRLPAGLGQPVVLQNLIGNGGAVATAAVAKTTPDGYTILYVNTATFVTTPIFERVPKYDPLKSFTAVTLLSGMPVIIAVKPSLPVQSIQELIALVKGSPGKYRYATAGPASISFLAGEMFKALAQVDIQGVPFRGPIAAVRSVADGDNDIVFDVPVYLAGSIKDGNPVRPLATMATQRASEFPDVVTTVEAGYPEMIAYSWSGLVAPFGTPAEAIDKLNRATRAVLSEIEAQTTFQRLGMTVQGSTPEDFRSLVDAELRRWSRALPLSATTQ